MSRIFAEYFALDRARIFRRLMVTRFGVLALGAFAVILLAHPASAYARWLPLVLLLVPPAWAWLLELRLEYRLSQLIDSIEGVAVPRLSRTDLGQDGRCDRHRL